MQRITALITLIFLFFGAGILSAHVVDIESQALLKNTRNAQAKFDYSFENPYVVPEGKILQARSIFAYLSRGDYDVYKYTVTPGEFAVMFGVGLLPAIQAYKKQYLTTALIGPGLPALEEGMEVPFDIPAGMGIIIKKQSKQDERMVYTLPYDEFQCDIRWFFPPMDEAVMHMTGIPGTYYFVVWSEKNKQFSYTMVIGNEENHSDLDHFQMDLLGPLG